MSLLSILPLLFFLSMPAGNTERELTGIVTSPDGAAIPGAVVYIKSAMFLPGRYSLQTGSCRDCDRSVKTDNSGAFRFQSVDPNVDEFQIFVLAKGYKSVWTLIDTKSGANFIEMKRHNLKKNRSLYPLRGRVVDPKDQPVEGAVVSISSYTGTDGEIYGCSYVHDSATITNERGEFIFYLERPEIIYDVRVEADNLAAQNFEGLAASHSEHRLKLGYGTKVTGRILDNNRPASGVIVSLRSIDLKPDNDFGKYKTVTNEKGEFLFDHIPPNHDFNLFSETKSIGFNGERPDNCNKIKTGNDGTELKTGDLKIIPSFVVAGKLVTSDGRAVPVDAKIIFDSLPYDHKIVSLSPDGRFEIELPRDGWSVNVLVNDYILSIKNENYRTYTDLVGRVDENITDLTILLEPYKEKIPEMKFDLSTWNKRLKGILNTENSE
jgi:hypothetical protein